jgi:hypothetical protein
VEVHAVRVSGFIRKMTGHSWHTDTAHGALCAILTLVLVKAGLPLWLVVALPLVAYAGLRLVTVSNRAPVRGRPTRTPPHNDRAAYAICVNRQ